MESPGASGGALQVVNNGRGRFALTSMLGVVIAGVDPQTASPTVDETYKVCPHLNAIRGNIDVMLSVKTR